MLNACRRQRNAHEVIAEPKGGLYACSTPVGVKGMLTRPWFSIAVCCVALCSTPVGVKGMLTILPVHTPTLFLRVLNACRRQRNAHYVHGVSDGAGQDVLNACRRQRNAHGLCVRQGTHIQLRAQRLSASKECSHGRIFILLPFPNSFVLNACRRQRNAHCCCCNSVGLRLVLCSTPVGVKGMLTK